MIAHPGVQWRGQAELDAVVGHSRVPASSESDISNLQHILHKQLSNKLSDGAHGDNVPSESLANTTFTMIPRLMVMTLRVSIQDDSSILGARLFRDM